MELDVLHVSPLYSPPTGRVPLAIRTLYYGPSPIFFPQNPSGHQHPLSTFCQFFWFTLSHHVNLCSLYRCRPNHPFPLIRSGLERCFTVFSVVDGLESVVLIRSFTRAAVSATHPGILPRAAVPAVSPGSRRSSWFAGLLVRLQAGVLPGRRSPGAAVGLVGGILG